MFECRAMNNVAWLFLLISGVLEAFWPIALKASDGFTKPVPSIIALGVIGGAVYCFSLAVKTISPSIAYIVFVGMGAVGVSIVGLVFQGESFGALKLLCILMVIGGAMGLHYVERLS